MNEKNHILTIDDDPTARAALEMLLEGEGYRLSFAINGSDGLQQTLQSRPDLVLLDAMMPEMHGFEVCRQIRAHPLVSALPVLIITSLDDAASRLQAFDAGADDVLSKPYNELELKARVRNIMRLNRYRRLIEQAEQLNHLAKYDPLTSLPNRASLQEQLQQWVVNAERQQQVFAVIYLDLDNFKQINESLGQLQGDLLLRQIARRLTECLSAGDMLARLVGNEFVLLHDMQDQLDESDVASHVKHLLDAISMPVLFDNHEWRLTACVGIAFYPNDAIQGETLLKNAEIAKSRAKAQGRQQYQFFTAQMNFNLIQRLAVENQLRLALEHDELRLYYQPLMQLQNTSQPRLVGLEVLLRWQHPERGLLTPHHFIDIAEQSGLIIGIGSWVLEMACRQGHLWHQQHCPVHLAVNTSSLQYQQLNWLSTVDRILHLTGFDPHYLELEITESLLMESEAQENTIIHLLQNLRSRGIRLSIDDFGTGYSALSYLRRFQVDILKIDQSFISDVSVEPNNAILVQAIIAMAHGLRLQVIAEGIEQQSQCDFLKANGCDIGQGYLFGYPQPVEEINAFIQKQFKSSSSLIKH